MSEKCFNSPGLALLSRKMEILENERYNPLAGGWGSGGLLPTDRKPYSNGSGTTGYSALKEVDEALLSAGWKWDVDGTWEVDVDESTDKDGWSYAADFGWYENGGKGAADGSTSRLSVGVQMSNTSSDASSTVFTTALTEGAELLAFENAGVSTGTDAKKTSSLVGGVGGVPVKSMIHFVRRRRKARFQTFDPEILADFGAFTCDHCDLEEIERLSAVLLNALAQASLRAHPRNLTEAKCNKLKSAMIEKLALRSGDIVHAGLYSSKVVASRLEEWCKDSLGSAWASLSGMVASGSPLEMLGRRTADVAHAFFPHEERRILAGLIIRRHDLQLQFHCGVPQCGSACEYRVEQCPHQGCSTVYSKKWANDHDGVCLQKIIPCERACGDHCIRRLMKAHMSQACPLRPAECPYRDLGCLAALQHKDVPEHLETCMPSHLLLAMARMQEQQSVIRDLHHRLGELEGTQTQLVTKVVAVSTSAAAAMNAIEVLAQKQDRALKEEVAAQNKAVKALANEVHGHGTTLGKHEQALAGVNKTLLEMKPFLQAMGAGKGR